MSQYLDSRSKFILTEFDRVQQKNPQGIHVFVIPKGDSLEIDYREFKFNIAQAFRKFLHTNPQDKIPIEIGQNFFQLINPGSCFIQGDQFGQIELFAKIGIEENQLGLQIKFDNLVMSIYNFCQGSIELLTSKLKVNFPFTIVVKFYFLGNIYLYNFSENNFVYQIPSATDVITLSPIVVKEIEHLNESIYQSVLKDVGLFKRV